MEGKNLTTRNNTLDPTARVILAFGSNQGDRAATIDRAIARATAIGPEEARSSRYESAPWGFTADTPFYNQVVAYRTTLDPLAVLRHCLEIERQLGRVRVPSARYASRTIDIDILFHGALVINHPDLLLPHPLLARRRFVLVPLAEILPGLLHPTLGKTIATLLEECTDSGAVSRCR